MKLIADLHTHSHFSGDAKGSIEQNVLAAMEKGLKRIAITDHGPRHLKSGVKLSDYPKIIAEIERLRELYADRIEILFGIESNFVTLKGQIDVPNEYANQFDFIALGHHKTARLKGPAAWWHIQVINRLFHNKKWVIDKNTTMYERAIENNRVNLIVHPNYAILVDVDRLSRFCKKHGVLMEINARHSEMSQQEIETARGNGVIFCINSDAHRDYQVGDFNDKDQLAEKCGITPQQVYNAEGYGGEIA